MPGFVLNTVLMPPPAVPLQGLTLAGLQDLLAPAGLSTHQARLVFQAIHRHGELEAEKMPAISAACGKFLRALPPPPTLTLGEVHRAQDGTIKLRLALPRGAGKLIVNRQSPIPKRWRWCLFRARGA